MRGRSLTLWQSSRLFWRDRELRGNLLGLLGWQALFFALLGVLWNAAEPGTAISGLPDLLLGLAGGLLAGTLLACLQPHPRRSLGLVPLAATGLLLGLGSAALFGALGWGLALGLGLLLGLGHAPLWTHYRRHLPAELRGYGMAVCLLPAALLFAALSAGLRLLHDSSPLSLAAQLWLLTALAALATIVAWYACHREVMEQALEVLIWPIYQIRGYGPGLVSMPVRGPVILVANHSAWFDPMWVGKVAPRRLIPMMTSTFYDLPILNWLVKYGARAIRVQKSDYRREAPELQLALEVLQRGDALLIFPEGRLRRSEERPLYSFGQGIWLLLQQRPDIPVIPCWVEGGWGSYCSYYNGRPTKNKRLDFWRSIRVAVSEPEVLPAELLADRRATRRYLMQRCLEARRHLGLEPFALPELLEETPAAVEPQEKAG